MTQIVQENSLLTMVRNNIGINDINPRKVKDMNGCINFKICM